MESSSVGFIHVDLKDINFQCVTIQSNRKKEQKIKRKMRHTHPFILMYIT